jgi:hypothetical protein
MQRQRKTMSPLEPTCFVPYSITTQFEDYYLLGYKVADGKPACHLLSCWYLGRLIAPWRWMRFVPPKRLLDFQRSTRRCISQDNTVHSHRCENLRSNIVLLQFVLQDHIASVFNSIRGLTIKFASWPPCACRGSSGQKPQYGLITLAYQRFTAVLLLICSFC